jgi:hypothetical protein
MAATFGGSSANGATPWGDTGYKGPSVTTDQAMSILGTNYTAPNNDQITFSDPNQQFPTLTYSGTPAPAPAAPSGGAVFGGTSPSTTGNSGGSTPSGGAVFGGTNPNTAGATTPTDTFTNNKGPLQVGTGTGSSNTGSSTTGTGIINSAITPWNVTKDQTVAGNIESLLAQDSPLMQQARTRANQQMASRGLINSSLAASAADSAMYDVANTIAQTDAATKAKASGYNVDQLNQQVTLDKQLANQMSQAQLSADTSRYSTDVNAATQKLNNESAQLIARLNNEQQTTLQRMQNENQRLLQTNQQAAQAYNNSMQYIDVINRDPNLDADAKTRAQAQIYYNLQTQLRTLAAVSGVDVTQSLSLANAPGFDDKGNYVGFKDNTSAATKTPTTAAGSNQTTNGGGS